MESELRIDHVVILVTSLEQATRDYEELGFTVVTGGIHQSGATRNALIGFSDGSYLELLSYARRGFMRFPLARRLGLYRRMSRTRSGLERRFLQRAGAGEGIIDFALIPAKLDEVISRAARGGVGMEGPMTGGRKRPDGEEIRWEMALPLSRDLPFLVSDLTDPAHRRPQPEECIHANGANGIAEVVVAVSNLEASSARYRSLLGTDPGSPTAAPLPRARARNFPVGTAMISLVTPLPGNRMLASHLGHRGESPVVVRLRGGAGVRALDPERAHQARLELIGDRQAA